MKFPQKNLKDLALSFFSLSLFAFTSFTILQFTQVQEESFLSRVFLLSRCASQNRGFAELRITIQLSSSHFAFHHNSMNTKVRKFIFNDDGCEVTFNFGIKVRKAFRHVIMRLL